MRAQQTGGPAPFSTDFNYDEDGNLIRMVSYGDANCDSALNNFDTDAFVAAILYGAGVPPYPDPDDAHSDYLNAGASQGCWEERATWGDVNGDGYFNNIDIDPWVTVLLGGASSPAYKTYVWDAENRLIEVHPAHPVGTAYSPANNDERWRYTYDYMSRRVEKHHEKYVTSAWVTQSRTRYVYDGWNLIEELKVPTSGDPTVSRQYTWGLDLSGLNGDSTVSGIHGAGGIGGLLAVWDTNNTTTTSDDRSFAYCYDANGNVGQLVEWASGAGGASGMAWDADRQVAKYEYDPYGNTVSKSGTYADTNPFRFSTKYLDDETGLYYYGYRYYSPRLGRWISRDPIEERGGVALNTIVGNETPNRFDILGRVGCKPGICGAGSAKPKQPLPPPPAAPGVDDSEGPAGRGATCGCKIRRTAICTLDPNRPSDLGHEWIDCSGQTFDYPAGYIESPCEKACPDPPVWEWSLHVRLVGGTLDDGKTPCSKATCTQIKACLQRQETHWDRPGNEWDLLGNNCINFVDDAASKCCMARGVLPTRAPGLFEEQKRCKERRECYRRHPECKNDRPFGQGRPL